MDWEGSKWTKNDFKMVLNGIIIMNYVTLLDRSDETDDFQCQIVYEENIFAEKWLFSMKIGQFKLAEAFFRLKCPYYVALNYQVLSNILSWTKY